MSKNGVSDIKKYVKELLSPGPAKSIFEAKKGDLPIGKSGIKQCIIKPDNIKDAIMMPEQPQKK